MMGSSGIIPTTKLAVTPEPCGPTWRQVLEFLVALLISVLLLRTFAAEAYVVPTGSMAPTLLGIHHLVTCPNCEHQFSLGDDEVERGGRPVCPNCGQSRLAEAEAQACHGDRLLVQKYLYDLRPPRRWEVVVFQSPTEPGQPYVKRVVGLPNESVQIRHGDVYIDGSLMRKPLEIQRAMRIPIHDSTHVPDNELAHPRWIPVRGEPLFAPAAWNRQDLDPEAWFREGGLLVHRGRPETPSQAGDSRSVDWLVYRHRNPGENRSGPVEDFFAYNGADSRRLNRVDDLMAELDLKVGPETRAIRLCLKDHRSTIHLRIPTSVESSAPDRLRVWIDEQLAGEAAIGDFDWSTILDEDDEPTRLEVSLIDRQLVVALDGLTVFEPLPLPDEPRDQGSKWHPRYEMFPMAIGVEGNGLIIDRVGLYRDVYYTARLANSPIRAHGVDQPYQLGSGEYFVLGDNSAESNDSRFWNESPVVRHEMLIGKPFLVHLPSQVVPLQVFGRPTYWIPDPRKIRYIR